MNTKIYDDKFITKRRRQCMTLVLIPVALFVLDCLCAVMAIVLEHSTDRGVLYTVFAALFLMIPFISPLPCIGMAGTGLALSRKVRAAGRSTKLIITLAVLDIIVSLIVAAFAVFSLYIGVHQ